MTLLPLLVWWGLIGLSIVLRWPLYIYLFSISGAFGDLTLVPLGLTSGVNLPVQAVCAVVLVWRLVGHDQNFRRALAVAFDLRKLGLATLFAVYAICSAFILPRLYQGGVMVYSLNAAASETPVAPSSANFNEAAYLAASTGVLFAFALSAGDPRFREHFLRSVLLTGIILIASGLAASASSLTGHGELLSPFHNAGYNLLSDQMLGGNLRVVGFMAEASVFGGTCCAVLAFLVFNAPMYPRHGSLLWGTVAGLVLGVLASTSSTGYIGLLVIAVLYVGRAVLKGIPVGVRSSISTRRLGVGVLVAVAAAGGVAWMVSSSSGGVTDLLNLVLFQKVGSSSFIERSAWTAAGVAAFMSTGGIGVGWGSVRTSNWLVNVAASTGFVGLLVLFMMSFVLLRSGRLPRATESGRLARGVRLALIPAVLMMCLSGTTPDPGVWVMSLVGMFAGLRMAEASRGESWRQKSRQDQMQREGVVVAE
jgi:hypothetical protein